MEDMVENLVRCLGKIHGVCPEEARSIIYIEWDFIDEIYREGRDDEDICQTLAHELLELYMVA